MTTTATAPSARRFSLAQLVLFIPWVALVIDAWAPIRDNSFLWHIRAGSLQAESARVLTEDPFSFTMLGTSWRTQSWLVELLYDWGESIAGLGFVPPLLLLASSVTVTGIGLIAYRRSGSVPATALLVLMSTTLLLGFLAPRPVVFSFALFSLVILAWDLPRLRWAVPFLMWVWASSHGSFAIGLAYIGLSLIAEREWRALPTAIVSGIATLTTAHGLGVLQILLDFSDASEALELMVEWRKPDVLSAVFLPFLIGVALLVVGAARRLIAPKHLWLIVPFLALGLSATRAVPPAWLALVPLVAISLSRLSVGGGRRFPARMAVVFLIVVAAVPFFVRSDAQLDGERFPLVAHEAMDDVRTFHDDVVGGYLIWAEGPGRLVYIDDRAELYLDRMTEFVAVRRGEIDWAPIFERDGIEQALLKADAGLVGELQAAGWQAAFVDESFMVLVPQE